MEDRTLTATAPAKPKAARVYRCDICGVRLRPDRWVYSQTRGVRYCPPKDWAACERRSLRLEPSA